MTGGGVLLRMTGGGVILRMTGGGMLLRITGGRARSSERQGEGAARMTIRECHPERRYVILNAAAVIPNPLLSFRTE